VSNVDHSSHSAVTVSWPTPQGPHRVRFDRAFCIGRDARGVLEANDENVDRALAAVFRRGGQWWVRDLDGSGGLLLDGQPIQSAPLPPACVLGLAGGSLEVNVEAVSVAQVRAESVPDPQSLTDGDGRTVLHGSEQRSTMRTVSWNAVPIRISVAGSAAREFTETIRVGRDAGCTIRIDDEGVSRSHAEFFRAGVMWYVRDLGSSNGTFLDGNAVTEAPLPAQCTVTLGIHGPRIDLAYDSPGGVAPKSLEEFAAHYLDGKSEVPAGDRTMMVRRAFSSVQRRQKRRYGSVIAGVAALLLVAIAVGIYQYVQLQRTRALAEQIFYNMKTIELQLARLETQAEQSADSTRLVEAERGRKQLTQMSNQYDALLEELGVVDDRLPQEDRLILHMARTFGECELAMPDGFVGEVKRYIDIWRSNDRLGDALAKAHGQNLGPEIARILQAHRMPPQFFYLALQESDFKRDAVGPATRFGIAKGLWQFMPETAAHYGLRTGPLRDERSYDPDDQRFDPAAATDAAARYLRDLYSGEAQASGLLVLASYNWGTTRVRNRIRAMKENPRDRNFWALLAQTDVPKETRDYVFLIFAAAVIGENPGLFGFDFDNPLKNPGAKPGKT
jgi:membrane-bound lytic murein transglycosylase D